MLLRFYIFFSCISSLISCQERQNESEGPLEICLDILEESPETLDKNSQSFIDYADKRALEIAKKLENKSFQKYNLAIVTIFQNEASYLKEWIEFHKLVGVEHFFLFNNLSTDNYLEVLKPYILNHEVDLIEWPYQTSDDGKNWPTIQRAAYLTAVKLTADNVKWLAIIDSDEFIVPVKSDNLLELMQEYEGYGGVGINWQMFGTSYVEKIPQGKLLTEVLLLKAPSDYPENLHIKSIVCPKHVLICRVHYSIFKEGFFEVDTSKQMLQDSRSSSVLTDHIVINHYWSRDEDFFYRTKIARRKKWQEEEQKMFERINNCNQEIDVNMLRFSPDLQEKMTLQCLGSV